MDKLGVIVKEQDVNSLFVHARGGTPVTDAIVTLALSLTPLE